MGGKDEQTVQSATYDQSGTAPAASDPQVLAPVDPPASGTETYTLLQDIHNDLQQAQAIDTWILGALMMIGGILTIIAFFTARGETRG